MVPIAHDTTLLTSIDSYRQWHHMSMPTVIACLYGVSRGHFDHVSLSYLKAMGTKGQRSQFVSVILAYVKQFCAQCFIRGKGCHMFLKLYCDVSLWLLRSQIGENFFEETVRLSRCYTPSPAWALLTPTCAVGIIRDMTPKCTMKPIYQLPISVSNAYLQKVTWILAICPTKTTPYHDRAFTIKQTGNICQGFYIQFWGADVTHYLIPFSHKCGEKCAPGCVCDRFVQPSLAACPVRHMLSCHFFLLGRRPFDHVAHDQRLDGDQPKAVDQFAGLLVHEVLASPLNALVDSCHNFSLFASFWGVPLRFGETTVRLSQVFFFFPEKAWVVNLFAGGEESKGLESHIDAYVLIRWRQSIWIDLIAREANKPLARRVSHYGACFDYAFCGPVLDQFDMPNLGKGELALYIDAETCLGVGEGYVAGLRFIARVTGLLSSIHTPEKGFEGFVDAMQHILQDLGVDGFIFWSDRFDGGKLGTLLREGDAEPAHVIGIFPLLQRGVIQLRAECKLLIQQAFFLFGWVETVRTCFLHKELFFSVREKGKVCSTHWLRQVSTSHSFSHFLFSLHLTRNVALEHGNESKNFQLQRLINMRGDMLEKILNIDASFQVRDDVRKYAVSMFSGRSKSKILSSERLFPGA